MKEEKGGGWSGNQKKPERKDKSSNPRHDAESPTSQASNLPDQLQLHSRRNEPTWAEKASTDPSSHFQGTSDPGAGPSLTDQRPPWLGGDGAEGGEKEGGRLGLGAFPPPSGIGNSYFKTFEGHAPSNLYPSLPGTAFQQPQFPTPSPVQQLGDKVSPRGGRDTPLLRAKRGEDTAQRSVC